MLSFISHHQALPDIPEFEAAVLLAKSAFAKLHDATDVESLLCNPYGWNRAMWTVHGGAYGGPERGGPEKENQPRLPPSLEEHGGWVVDTGMSPTASDIFADL
jgi:hypothetical protein